MATTVFNINYTIDGAHRMTPEQLAAIGRHGEKAQPLVEVRGGGARLEAQPVTPAARPAHQVDEVLRRRLHGVRAARRDAVVRPQHLGAGGGG